MFVIAIATFLGTLAGILVFEAWRQARRKARRNPGPKPYTEEYEDEGVRRAAQMKRDGTFPTPGWVAETIKKHEEERSNERKDSSA